MSMAVLTAINGARELSRKGCMRIGREGEGGDVKGREEWENGIFALNVVDFYHLVPFYRSEFSRFSASAHTVRRRLHVPFVQFGVCVSRFSRSPFES